PAASGRSRLANPATCCRTPGRDDAGGGGEVAGVARLPCARIALPGRAVFSRSGEGRAEFWRNVRSGLRRVRAAEFRDVAGDTEGDCCAHGGGGAEEIARKPIVEVILALMRSSPDKALMELNADF